MNADCFIIWHLKEKCDIRRFTFQGQRKNDYDVFRYRNPTTNLINWGQFNMPWEIFLLRWPISTPWVSIFSLFLLVYQYNQRGQLEIQAHWKPFQMTCFLIVDLELDLDLTLIRLGGWNWIQIINSVDNFYTYPKQID